MAARREESRELSYFADALRHALGLDPLYQSGDRPEDTDVVRFYMIPHSEGPTRTPKRGSAWS